MEDGSKKYGESCVNLTDIFESPVPLCLIATETKNIPELAQNRIGTASLQATDNFEIII